jgi:hypothetical protein
MPGLIQVGHRRILFRPDSPAVKKRARDGPGPFVLVLMQMRQFVGVITISTRRFTARPAAVAFEVIGS